MTQSAEERAISERILADLEASQRRITEQVKREQEARLASSDAISKALKAEEVHHLRNMPGEYEIENFSQWDKLPAIQKSLWAAKYNDRFKLLCLRASGANI